MLAAPSTVYCVGCKAKRPLVAAEAVFTVGGTPATRGKCGECGRGVFKMGRTAVHEGLTPPPIQRAKGKKKPKRAAAKRRGKLVVVESPAKARSIGSILGSGYRVQASLGHVRDLLTTRLSVDVVDGFRPTYRVPNQKREVVKGLRALAARAERIYLATDPDREGEAIAWHLTHAAEMETERVQRVVFHEITADAVRQAFEQPRSLDTSLIDAQQARRILDRLVGYNITELLWRKMDNGLSAGRVQSVALRLVVEREREIAAFIPEESWTIDVALQVAGANGAPRRLQARLREHEGTKLALTSEAEAQPHVQALERARYLITAVNRGKRRRWPNAPFITSTLQQEASSRLGYGVRKTMALAQQLYEGIELEGGERGGLITYMRTDSVSVAKSAQDEARSYVRERFGGDFVPKQPPKYKTRARAAQEAHEAIRPTSATRTPEALEARLEPEQLRLYRLIWRRFLASQMSVAVYDTMQVEIAASEGENAQPLYSLGWNGSSLRFAGFLALLGMQDEVTEPLPALREGDRLALLEVLPEQHFTQPPPRYSEATLVRVLEESGIGRPSTYAPTVSVLQQREYVVREGARMKPTDIGTRVCDRLVEYFPDIVDVTFTARLEDELDAIARGAQRMEPMLAKFYGPFEKALDHAREHMPAEERLAEALGRPCPECGREDALVLRRGRFGRFIGCRHYPDCAHTEPFYETVGPCPLCHDEFGGLLQKRRTRKGRQFYGCSRYPDCDYTTWQRPQTANKEAERATGLSE